MAKIKVRDIKPTGVDLFEDSESFLNEVSNDELEQAFGGMIAVDAARIAPIKTIYTYPFPTRPFPTIICTYPHTLPYTAVIL